MHKKLVAAALSCASLAAVAPSYALAQTSSGQSAQAQTPPDSSLQFDESGAIVIVTGAELHNQKVQVETPSGANTLEFGPDGTIRITVPSGREVARGRWSVENRQMCIRLDSGARECVPYARAFEAGRTVSLTSDCGNVSQWTALAVNPLPPRSQQ